MRCNRCQGLMVEDRFLDILSSGDRWVFAWRCAACGNVEDAQTRHNRILHPSPRQSVKKNYSLPI